MHVACAHSTDINHQCALSEFEQGDVNLQPKNLVWAAIARFVTVALFFDATAPLFPQMAASHQLSSGTFQTLLGVCYVTFAVVQLASAPVIEKIGLYRSSAFSCVYLGVASALLCSTRSPELFAAFFLSMFAVNSIGANATRVALREATSDAGYKRLFAWATGGIEIKQIVMPVIAGTIASAFGWRWALMALVVPVVIAGIWIEIADQGRQAKPDCAVSNNTGLSSWKTIVMMPAFLVPTLIAAAFQIAFSPLSARLPFILANEALLEPAMVGLVLSGASGLVATGLFLCGHLVSRWPSARLLSLGVGIMAGGLLLTILSNALGISYAIGGVILVQGALGFIVVPCSGDALSASETQRVKASALFGFIQAIVAGLSVTLAGVVGLPNVGGSITLTALSLGLILTIGMIAIRRRRQ